MKRRLAKYLTLIFMVVILLVGTCGGCSFGRFGKSDANSSTATDAQKNQLDDVTIDSIIADILKKMPLEEKIGQLFMVYTDSLDYNAETSITDKMKEMLDTYHPGGILFFSFNLESADQIKAFIADSQKDQPLPMFIAVDEEGGKVSRLANQGNMKVTRFPSMAEIGASGDVTKAFEVGDTLGRQIKDLGFNLDFAPVADLALNQDNEEIGARSFGSDVKLVSDMASQVVKGLQGQGVSATLKHFPGQGALTEDTHKGFANLDRNIDELRAEEFKPFKAGIKAGADFVMMSHTAVQSVTTTEEPASLSYLMVTDILRNELKFKGIVITDAMNMKVITKFYEADEAAIKAIEAGNDMILLSDDFETAYEGLLRAVKDGTISEDRIDESLARIFRVKIERGVINVDLNRLQEDE